MEAKMIHWAWALLTWSLGGFLGFIIGAMCRVSATADEAAQDESHSATRYGARTTAPRMRVLPEEVKERQRAEWAKAEEVEPDIEAHR
jgi:hypothetical protein